MLTADQIVCHLVGDYLLQSDWMATEKTKRSLAAACHALAYSVSFLFLRPSIAAMAFIIISHFVIDRWRLARYVVWAKNWLCPFLMMTYPVKDNFRPKRVYIVPWAECQATGYPPGMPVWMSVWLLIIADNTLHLICNGFALRFL